VFPAEIPIFRREYFNGMYSVLAYYLSKTAAEFPSYFALPFVHSIIVYFMFGKFLAFVSVALQTITFQVGETNVYTCPTP